MDFTDHCARLLAHYQRLVNRPGWRDYVLGEAEKLAKAEPGLYGDFPKLLRQHQPPKG